MGRAARGTVPRGRRRVTRLRWVVASLLVRRLLVVALLRRRVGVLLRRVAIPLRRAVCARVARMRAVCAGVARHGCGVFRIDLEGIVEDEGGVSEDEVEESSREKEVVLGQAERRCGGVEISSWTGAAELTGSSSPGSWRGSCAGSAPFPASRRRAAPGSRGKGQSAASCAGQTRAVVTCVIISCPRTLCLGSDSFVIPVVAAVSSLIRCGRRHVRASARLAPLGMAGVRQGARRRWGSRGE